MVQPLWKLALCFLKKLNIFIIHPVIKFLVYPKELTTYVHTDTFTDMFTVILFNISKIRNNLLLGSNQDTFHEVNG